MSEQVIDIRDRIEKMRDQMTVPGSQKPVQSNKVQIDSANSKSVNYNNKNLLKGEKSNVVEEVTAKEADEYYNSRPYKNRISAWASSQSQILDKRDTFLSKIKEFEKKYPDQNNVPRPPHWSGWRVLPDEIEFWVDGEGRIHERLNYKKNNGKWEKELLYP